MTREEVGELLEKQKYKFARTMPWNPHWYTLKETWDDGDLYKYVIGWILENGEMRIWGKQKPRRYFDYGIWRYWPMTTDPEESILLNRCKIATCKSKPVIQQQLTIEQQLIDQ
jgi:hypothetical protein|tara:strand:+ start:2445 stop:2783 length:339 start_codon:yes stop_codon:yes gene_type:complete